LELDACNLLLIVEPETSGLTGIPVGVAGCYTLTVDDRFPRDDSSLLVKSLKRDTVKPDKPGNLASDLRVKVNIRSSRCRSLFAFDIGGCRGRGRSCPFIGRAGGRWPLSRLRRKTYAGFNSVNTLDCRGDVKPRNLGNSRVF
jgi:hypothetical protein